MIEVVASSLALGATCVLVTLGLFGLDRSPILRVTRLTLAAAILWTSGALLMSATTGVAWESIGSAVGYTGGIFVPPLFWVVTLRWARDRELIGDVSPLWTRAPLVWAAVLWVAMLANPLHGAFLTPVDGTRSVYGPLWWAMAVPNHALGLGMACFTLALSARARSADNRREALLLAGATLVVTAAHAAHAFSPTPLPLDLPSVAIAISSALMVAAIRGDAARRTHRRELQALVATRTGDLENANARLRALQTEMLRAERLQTAEEVGSRVAHAINNPLTALIGHAELATHAAPDDTRAATVLRLALRVRDVAERTLRLYRKGSMELREIDPRDVVADAVEMVRPLAEDVGIVLEVDVDDATPRIHGDRALLGEALSSLARNSIEAMPSGGHLGIRVSGDTDAAEAGVVFSVSDTGGGLPDLGPETLFEPFVTTRPAGTGLGLSIVRGIVTGHRGRVDLRERTPSGTLARIRIPAPP